MPKISELATESTPTTSAVVPVVQSGTTFKATLLSLFDTLQAFIQNATGSVYRTITGKLRERVSVVDFGAVGDGSTHPLSGYYSTLAEAQLDYPHATALTQEMDWAAAQAALNYLGERAGGVVRMPKLSSSGYYVLNDTLKVPDGVTLDGEGSVYATSDGEHIVSSAVAGVVSKNGYDDTDNSQSIGIKNLKIKITAASAEGLVLAACKRGVVDNVVVVLQAGSQTGLRMLAEKGSRTYGGNFYNQVSMHVINNGGGSNCIAANLTGIVNDGQNNANNFWIHQEGCDKGIVVGPALSNNFYGPSLEDNTTLALQFMSDAIRNTVWGAHVEGAGGTTVVTFDSGSAGNRVFIESYTTAMTLVTDSGSNNELVYDNVIYSGAATKHKRFRSPTSAQDLFVVGPKGVYHGDGTVDPTTASSVGRNWRYQRDTLVTTTTSTSSPTVTIDCNSGYHHYINMATSTTGTVTIDDPANSFADGEIVTFELINNSGITLTIAWDANYIRNASLTTSMTNGQRYSVMFRRRGTSWVIMGSPFGPI